MPKYHSSSAKSSSSSSSGSPSSRQRKRHDSTGRKKLKHKHPVSIKKLRALRDCILEEKFGYSDVVNPFGDPDLSKPFVWEKKKELLEAKGERLENETLLTQTTSKFNEIERIRKSREEREREQRLLEEQQSLLARERELENYASWVEKEEAYHRDAAQQRSEIRIKEGRPTACDLLVKMLWMNDLYVPFEDLSLPDVPPHILFHQYTTEELDQLAQDVQTQIDSCIQTSLDTPDVAQRLQKYQQFLTAVQILIQEQQLQNKKVLSTVKQSDSIVSVRDASTGLAVGAMDQIKQLLLNKSLSELEVMEKAISQKLEKVRNDLKSSEDPTYWEAVADMVPYHKALALTRNVYENSIKISRELEIKQKRTQATEIGLAIQKALETNQNMIVHESTSVCEQPSDRYRPPLIPLKNIPDQQELMTIQQFYKRRAELKKDYEQNMHKLIPRILEKHQPKQQPSETTTRKSKYTESASAKLFYEQFVRQEQMRMDEDEVLMTPAYVVSSTTQQPSIGLDGCEHKFKLRKPRFLNRVKTGYEWSKYNQTHYDRDNPPPKIVQGYKFNVFYSDLIDTTQTPKWRILSGDTSDTVMLLIQAGPPYEDIQFRIINREWDLHPRSGFKNTFERGVLQLHFNFKRFRYRR